MRKEQDLFAYLIERDKLRVEDWLKDEIRHLKEQERFTCRVSSKATLTEDIRIMLDLYRISWAGNWGFAPLSDGEADVLVKELKGLLNPDFSMTASPPRAWWPCRTSIPCSSASTASWA